MGDYFASLNLGVKKQDKDRRLHFAFFQVWNVKPMKKSFGVSVGDICMEWGRLEDVQDERFSGLSYEKDVPL